MFRLYFKCKPSPIPHGQRTDKTCPRTHSAKAPIFMKLITPDGIFSLKHSSHHHNTKLSPFFPIFLPNIADSKSSFLFKVKLDVILSHTLGNPVTTFALFLTKSLTFLFLGSFPSAFKSTGTWKAIVNKYALDFKIYSSFFSSLLLFVIFTWVIPTPYINFCHLL